jgi:UDP-GlcNAc3NAcA epimerase
MMVLVTDSPRDFFVTRQPSHFEAIPSVQKLLTVVGARPQFIKSAPVSLALKAAGIEEILIHTGQHYDENMSGVFFKELGLPQPRYSLNIGSGGHGYQTGQGLIDIEQILLDEKPDAVLVYGDTNATLSGALAASKLHIPIAHIEAGLRSYNRKMPEEINRVMSDHLASWLFCPTRQAVNNLAQEGITQQVFQVGDVMLDAFLLFQKQSQQDWPAMQARWAETNELSVVENQYILLTTHRAETTDQPEAILALLRTLDATGFPVLYPAHPRVRPLLESFPEFQNIEVMDPVSYLEMIQLESHAKVIVTDSGGVQKESAFVGVPCITLRTETEWVETVETGWNTLTGLDAQQLNAALKHVTTQWQKKQGIHHLYGNGLASQQIAQILSGKTSEISQPDACSSTVLLSG